MATASCWQASSLAPTQAAIIARYLIIAGPLTASFSTGRSSTARRPSRSASSLCPRAASIRPSAHHGGPKFGCAWTIFSCSARASVKADRALPSSLAIRAITPSINARLQRTSSPRLIGSSRAAIKASFAAATSRSASAQ